MAAWMRRWTYASTPRVNAWWQDGKRGIFGQSSASGSAACQATWWSSQGVVRPHLAHKWYATSCRMTGISAASSPSVAWSQPGPTNGPRVWYRSAVTGRRHVGHQKQHWIEPLLVTRRTHAASV